MEDFDFAYQFNNITFYHIAPYIDELGFKIGGRSLTVSNRTYDNVLYYKKTLYTKHNKFLCDKMFKTKYNVYFCFYDDYVYITGLNSLMFNSSFGGWKEVRIMQPSNNEFGSIFSEFKNIDEVEKAIEFIKLYIDNPEKAKAYTQQLKNDGKRFFKLYYRNGNDNDLIPII